MDEITWRNSDGRHAAYDRRRLRFVNPPRCVCGYQSGSPADLAEHVTAMMHVSDGQSHIEAH
jgi:hypothetical protein